MLLWERRRKRRPPGLAELNENVARIGVLLENWCCTAQHTVDIDAWFPWHAETVRDGVKPADDADIAAAWGESYERMKNA